MAQTPLKRRTKEIGISAKEIPISLFDLCIPLRKIGISFAEIPIFPEETAKPPVDSEAFTKGLVAL